MGLAQMDQDALSGWVQAGEHTRPFFDWLLEPEGKGVWEAEGRLVTKVRQENFLFLYLTEKKGQYLRVNEALQFGGLFCGGMLHDVQEPLREALGIPEGIQFQSKDEAAAELEQKVSEKVQDLIEHHWDEILAEQRYETRQILPLLNREEVRGMAESYYLNGTPIEQVAFQPSFSFGRQFPDTHYLMYLEHDGHAVNAIAKQWVRKHVPEISKKRILYGCIREEMRDIPDNGRLAKVRLIRESLAGLEGETMLAEIRKKGSVLPIHMRAEALMDRQGRYSLSGLATRERQQFERQYGRTAILLAEDIRRVSLGRKVLYTAGQEQEAA